MDPDKALGVVGYVVLTVVLVYLVLSVMGIVKIPWATVGGFSMEPTLEAGTLVVLCPVPSNVTSLLGHVVVYDHYGEYIIHRVIGVYPSGDTYYIVTKGDANQVADPWETPVNQVYGVVCLGVQYIGLITLTLRKPPTLILAIVVLLVLWLVLDEAEKRVNSRDAP
ncbi:MAG: signal peptidase I [Caldivirga sp.]